MPELDLDADLRLSVTSATGERTSGRLTGTGREVRLDVERPDVLFSAVNPADAGRFADALSAAGVTVRVFGPGGPAGVIGAGASSRLGRIVTGSPAVAPSLSGAVRTVSSTARAALTRRPGASLAGAGIAVLVAVAVLRNLRRG